MAENNIFWAVISVEEKRTVDTVESRFYNTIINSQCNNLNDTINEFESVHPGVIVVESGVGLNRPLVLASLPYWKGVNDELSLC